MSHGWMKERFLRNKRATAVLTVGAEAANAIPVTIQLQTEDGVNIAEVRTLHCEVLDVNTELAVAANYTSAETGTGAEVSPTAQPGLIITTSALGAAIVTVTDVSGVASEIVYLRVTPLSDQGTPSYAALTFA